MPIDLKNYLRKLRASHAVAMAVGRLHQITFPRCSYPHGPRGEAEAASTLTNSHLVLEGWQFFLTASRSKTTKPVKQTQLCLQSHRK